MMFLQEMGFTKKKIATLVRKSETHFRMFIHQKNQFLTERSARRHKAQKPETR